MPFYRLYTLEAGKHIASPPREIECETDELAVQRATQLLDGKDIEVWERARLVTRLSSKDS